jgi:hypothetical protein
MVEVLFCADCTCDCAGKSDFKEEEKMKGVSFFVCKVILAIVLFVFVFLPCGCSSYEQPGETAAEGRRRHQRALRINQQQMMADLDTLMLLDKPSKLTDKRIP